MSIDGMSEESTNQSEYSIYSPGTLLQDRFLIVDLLGSGNKGIVYKANDSFLNIEVALKFLLTKEDRDLVRFQQEARLASKINHKGIATIFDFGILENTPFLCMEYVKGESLQHRLEQAGTLSVEQFCLIFLPILESLKHAHQAGIVHRDLKPSNIIISEDSEGTIQTKILDFGLAKRLDLDGEDGKITPTGNIVGSPNYMSPEQVTNESIDAKSDIYSLGCIMWQSLAGRPVFDADSVMQAIWHQANTEPPDIEEHSKIPLPAELVSMIDKTLAKDKDERPEIEAVTRTLTSILEKEHEKPGLVDPVESDSDNAHIKPNRSAKFRFAAAVLLLVLCPSSFWLFGLSRAAILPPMKRAKIERNVPPKNIESNTTPYNHNQVQDVLNNNSHKLSLRYQLAGEIKQCAKAANLRELDISYCDVTKEDMQEVELLKNLEKIKIEQFSQNDLRFLTKLPRLTELDLRGRYLTDDSIKELSKIDSLSFLTLGGKQLSNKCLAHLEGLNLDFLMLYGKGFTNEAVPYLNRMKKLRGLGIGNTAIDARGISEYLRSRGIFQVKIVEKNAIARSEIERLRRAFPLVSFIPEHAFSAEYCTRFKKYFDSGKYQLAYDELNSIHDLIKQQLGSDTPLPDAYCLPMFMLCQRLGRIEESKRYEGAAIRLGRGSGNVTLVQTLTVLADFNEASGDIADCLKYKRDLVSLLKNTAPGSPEIKKLNSDLVRLRQKSNQGK